MRSYRLRIKQKSGIKTPWHSDTLWGCLCWVYHDLYGTDALESFLCACREGNAPLILSDAFPAGFLPMPAGGIFYELPNRTESKQQSIERMKQSKAIKNLKYLTVSQFRQVTQGGTICLDEKNQTPETYTAIQMHNSIDRGTNTTTRGALFQEIWHYPGNDGLLDLYILVREDFPFLACLSALAQQGLGGGASKGFGTFEFDEPEPFTFDPPQNPNGFITLSHCTPSKDMSTNAQYRLHMKYGRHGHDRSREGQPYKKPVVQFEPGAVFWGELPEKGYCGTLVERVSYDYPDTVQCGLSIAVPACIRETMA